MVASLADPKINFLVLKGADGSASLHLVNQEDVGRKIMKGTIVKNYLAGSVSKGPTLPNQAIEFKPALSDLIVGPEDKIMTVKDCFFEKCQGA